MNQKPYFTKTAEVVHRGRIVEVGHAPDGTPAVNYGTLVELHVEGVFERLARERYEAEIAGLQTRVKQLEAANEKRNVTDAFLTMSGRFGENVRRLIPEFFEWTDDGLLNFKGFNVDLWKIAHESGCNDWKGICAHIRVNEEKVTSASLKNARPTKNAWQSRSHWYEIETTLQKKSKH